MVAGIFYDLMIEWKQYQEEAYCTLYWTSLSIPKGVIPPIYVYYPERVGSAPYQIQITNGPTVAN